MTLGVAARSAAVAVAAVALGACASPGASTRLTLGDVEGLTASIGADLAASDVLAGRTPDSPKMVVAMDRAENLSSDIIPVSELWWLVERVRAALDGSALARERAVVFVIPAERAASIRARAEREGDELGAAFAEDRRPTHAMRATIRSVTRSGGADRTDLYAADYGLTDLATGETVWSASYLLKRTASGRAWD